VGADADSRMENVRVVDLVALAIAAVAAADASRPPEPPSVHCEGESTLCQPDARVSPHTSAAAPVIAFLPAASLPAVTYSLPKNMGSALGWTNTEREPLGDAYLEVTSDAVKGTARPTDNLWATVHERWAEKMRNNGPLRVGPLPSALEKQFKRIWAGVSAFTSHYLAVKSLPTTGNPSEEDIISGAAARYYSLDVYDAIRGDRNQYEANFKTGKRKAKVAHCKWVSRWRVLRQSDKFSCAANGGDSSGMDVLGDASSDEDEGGIGSDSCISRRTGGFQGRPVGINAAKMQRREDLKMEAQVKASTEALCKLTDAQHERTSL